MSEKTMSPFGSFLTMSVKTLELMSASPSISTSAELFALITISRSEPTTSTPLPRVLIYIPCREGVAGLGSLILDTV